eukprot:CAMPEP_0177715298 /NCGR_PEP_ID=MMETSP0484_2-20121128/13919_1 /TAXON_ID=354590 /ORGANISM="Rhodomonas lens, Strain RHODO" /LENGTH=423 /DNA_ID=CAMNT_0019227287 /DNA_START=16 /DNA_END=1284 /DNA_ORIENTATION=-
MTAVIGSKSFATLDEAIKAARSGDTVKISGEFSSPVSVPESASGVSIVGDNATISTSGKPAIMCAGRDVKVSNVTLRSKDATCVEVPVGGSLSIVDCKITATGASGIVASGGLVRAENSQVEGCGLYGVLASDAGRVECVGLTATGNAKAGLLARGAGSIIVAKGRTESRKNQHGAGCDEGGKLEISDSSLSENQFSGCNVGPNGAKGCKLERVDMVKNAFGCSINSSELFVTGCAIRDSSKVGVLTKNTGAPYSVTLQTCQIVESKINGITAEGQGVLRGKQLLVTDSQTSGVLVDGSVVQLYLSTISKNEVDAVAVRTSASGVPGRAILQQCTLQANRRFGASVLGVKAQLSMQGGVCSGNGGGKLGSNGITVANGGFAEVVGGAKVINNKGNGIFVAKGSVANVRGSTVEGNEEFGAKVE